MHRKYVYKSCIEFGFIKTYKSLPGGVVKCDCISIMYINKYRL